MLQFRQSHNNEENFVCYLWVEIRTGHLAVTMLTVYVTIVRIRLKIRTQAKNILTSNYKQMEIGFSCIIAKRFRARSFNGKLQFIKHRANKETICKPLKHRNRIRVIFHGMSFKEGREKGYWVSEIRTCTTTLNPNLDPDHIPWFFRNGTTSYINGLKFQYVMA